MRESREAKHAERAAAEHAARVQAASTEASAMHDALEAARLPRGETDVPGVMLQRGEVAYLTIEGAAFVEPKRAPGQWQGRSSGASIRVAKGVSYRVGGSRGTFVQGEERPTPTDTGTFVVTDRRCLFIGSKRTTEWAFSKLVGYDTDGPGTAFFNVSNRQKTTGVLFGTEVENQVDALIAGALARFTGPEQHASLIAAMEAEYRYLYDAWRALEEGREPPERADPLPSEEMEPTRELGSGATPATLTDPALRDVLTAAGFAAANDSEGYAIKPDGSRFKVMWVGSDHSGREECVPEMAKVLREAGFAARVAREDGYPYASVTGH
jgi:hypothetical protein